MFGISTGQGRWSERGLRFLKLSIVMCILLSVLDGVLRGVAKDELAGSAFVKMAIIWVYDFRNAFEEGILASVLLFVGAKIFETRTLMSIGYDTVDASKIAVKGPDDNNIVWVGRRYGSSYEAEVVATAFAERIGAADKAG